MHITSTQPSLTEEEKKAIEAQLYEIFVKYFDAASGTNRNES